MSTTELALLYGFLACITAANCWAATLTLKMYTEILKDSAQNRRTRPERRRGGVDTA